MMRVLSYGEALVDFLPDRRGPLPEVASFTKTIGGAPANAAVGLARLGCDVGLMGKIGADPFGDFLAMALEAEGVDIAGVVQTTEAKTGITFISLDETGDRSFLFYREPSADMTIRADEIDASVIEAASVFLAGSNLLTEPTIREATYHALNLARGSDRFIVLDPNVRLHLWEERDVAFEHVRRELTFGDVVKLNEEELDFVTGGGTPEALWSELSTSALALVLTGAEAGARVYTHQFVVEVEAPSVDVVDTTGAGDGFVAGLIAGIVRLSDAETAPELRTAVADFGRDDWRRVLAVGCHVGTEVCKRLGATPALPTHDEVPWERLGL